jgi:hypothetical protein
MAISRKPARQSSNPGTDEKKVLEVIERGGSVPGEDENQGEDEGLHAFTLRMESDLVRQVDEAVKSHRLIRSRNMWIVNAIIEQLEREK